MLSIMYWGMFWSYENGPPGTVCISVNTTTESTASETARPPRRRTM